MPVPDTSEVYFAGLASRYFFHMVLVKLSVFGILDQLHLRQRGFPGLTLILWLLGALLWHSGWEIPRLGITEPATCSLSSSSCSPNLACHGLPAQVFPWGVLMWFAASDVLQGPPPHQTGFHLFLSTVQILQRRW